MTATQEAPGLELTVCPVLRLDLRNSHRLILNGNGGAVAAKLELSNADL
jgi:hypothetical protein